MNNKNSYFVSYEARRRPARPRLSSIRALLWHITAGLSIGFGALYLNWRWSNSFASEVPLFWATVLGAEFLSFIGLILFYFDIWDEGDTEINTPPTCSADLHLHHEDPIKVDIFITTFDEDKSVVKPSIDAALNVDLPKSCELKVHLLDDGNRSDMLSLASNSGVHYHSRSDRAGFKAGNVREALLNSDGDFVVICDADTRLYSSFVCNTLGYFRDEKVSWVQTPHWFYDIPAGFSIEGFLRKKFGRSAIRWNSLVRQFLGSNRVGADPFMNSPDLFFDIIQRRRNRNNASFSCGAGSIYRREAMLDVALKDGLRRAKLTNLDDLSGLRREIPEPLNFHISEDIFTSIKHHQAGWKSIYHPSIEARMLSPQDLRAWLQQRLRYAAGTYDIMLRHNPIFRFSKGSMSISLRLHYAATFWSYFSVIWFPVLYFAPAFSLLTGLAPVSSFSSDFFLHILPFLFLSEIALNLSCKNFDPLVGRANVVALWPYHFIALMRSILKRRIDFETTPKIPKSDASLKPLWPHAAVMLIFLTCLSVGLIRYAFDDESYTTSFVTANLFWLAWNVFLTIRAVGSLFFGECFRQSCAATENRRFAKSRYE